MKNTQNLPELPNRWIWKKLGDFCETTSGGTPSRKIADFYGGNISWLKSGELNNSVILKAEEFISKKGLDNSNAKIFPKGTLLIALYGATVGKLGILGLEAATNQAICAISPSPDVARKFLFWYLLSIRGQLLNVRVGGAQLNISQQILRAVHVPLPPLDEQQHIVAKIEELFTQIDAGVAALEQARARLKRYRQAVLHAAVTGKLTREWREYNQIEPPNVENVGVNGLGLSSLPDGWKWVIPIEIGVLNRGKSKHRPRNAPFLYGGPYPFIQTGDVRQANGTIKEYHQTYNESGLKQSRLWPAGTLCITIAANIAETAMLGFDACFPDSIVGFVANPEICNIQYVEFFFRTAKDNLERYAPATAQKNINLDILSKLKIPLPPLKEQGFIVAELERRFSVADDTEKIINQSLQRASRLRQSILQRAFSGKLV